MDLILELPGKKRWAVAIKRTTAPRGERGRREAIENNQPGKAFILYGGTDRYPKGNGMEAISLREMASELAMLSQRSTTWTDQF